MHAQVYVCTDVIIYIYIHIYIYICICIYIYIYINPHTYAAPGICPCAAVGVHNEVIVRTEQASHTYT
jgi:hypothetical protein